MSERNVELHRRYIEAFNARDVEAIVACCDPNIEFHTTFAEVGGVYHGHGGMRTWHRDMEDAWGDEIHVEPEALFDLGEHTLAFLEQRGRGARSGVEVEMPITFVARWRDGLMVFVKVYAHREEALSDLGVSEDGLEPIDP